MHIMRRPPLSVRTDKKALEAYQVLYDDIPLWMIKGTFEWAASLLDCEEHLQAAEQYFRVILNWQEISYGHRKGVAQLFDLVGIDLLDYCLGVHCSYRHVETLQDILDRSGSAWTVGEDPDEYYCLERRVDETAAGAADEEIRQRSNAAAYLRKAWHQAYGLNPNPSDAFRNAVRAVEAAARPVVTPRDNLATLGKMIPALGDKPEKWQTVIGDVDTVRKMMETIWKSQFDRHGTDDTTRPLNVSQPEAEAAVQMSVTLVQLFRTGAIERKHGVP